MKKLLIILLSLYSLVSLCGTVLAQEETDLVTTQQSNQYFDLKLTKVSQSVLNKSIKYQLEITPKYDSPKTQILWEAPLAFDVNPKHDEFVSLSTGQTYLYEATVKPTRSGVYGITATVTSWQFDTNYTNTVSDTLTLSDSLVAQPVSSDYQVGIILFVVLILLVSGLSIWGVIILTKRLMVKTKRWLTPPS